jgi:hypothetical protein
VSLTIRVQTAVALLLAGLGAFALARGPAAAQPCGFAGLRLHVSIGGNSISVPASNEVVAEPGQTVILTAIVVPDGAPCGAAFSFDWRHLLGSEPPEVESLAVAPTEAVLRLVAGQVPGDDLLTLTVRDATGAVQVRRSLLVRVREGA